MNLKILNGNIPKKELSTQMKQEDNKVDCDFEKSFESSLNSFLKIKKGNSLNNIDDKNFKNNIDEKELGFLGEIIYLLNLFNLNINHEENVFNFDKNFENFHDELNIENVLDNRLELFFEKNLNEDSISKILSSIGFDRENIDLKNISNGEVIQNLLNNNEDFNKFIKDEILKFGDNELTKNISDYLESSDFLKNREVFKNIKNELIVKLNEVVNKSQTLNNDENLKNNFIDFGISDINKVKSNVKSQETILKEISGNEDFYQNISSQVLGSIKNNERVYDKFDKTIDMNDQDKFVREFIDTVKYVVTNNKSEMVIKISPDNLGKIDLKYEMLKDSVRLMIKTENMETFKIIEGIVFDIKNMIKENHQINLENIQVDLSQSEFTDSSNQNNNNENNPQRDNRSSNIKLNDDDITKDKNDLRTGVLV